MVCCAVHKRAGYIFCYYSAKYIIYVNLFNLAATVVPHNVAVQRSPDGLSMNVSWTPVSLAKARGFPLYVVSYGPQNSLKKRREVMQAFSNGSFAVISGLDPRQSYSVTLSVQTMAGSISSNMSVTSMSPIESGPSTIIYGQYSCTHFSAQCFHWHFIPMQVSLEVLLLVLWCSH